MSDGSLPFAAAQRLRDRLRVLRAGGRLEPAVFGELWHLAGGGTVLETATWPLLGPVLLTYVEVDDPACGGYRLRVRVVAAGGPDDPVPTAPPTHLRYLDPDGHVVDQGTGRLVITVLEPDSRQGLRLMTPRELGYTVPVPSHADEGGHLTP